MNFTPGGQSALLRPWHFPRPPPLALSPSKPAVPAEKSTLRYLRLVPLRKLAPYPKMGPKEARAMKKVLWSITAATLILTLAGCSNATTPIQLEDQPLRPVVETVPEDAGPVESEAVVLSAGNDQLVDSAPVNEDTESSVELKSQVESPTSPHPQEPQATVTASVTFLPDSKKETMEPPSPAPSEPTQAPEPEPAPIPALPVEPGRSEEPAPPADSEPSEPAFSIDHWIS